MWQKIRQQLDNNIYIDEYLIFHTKVLNSKDSKP